MRVGSWLTFSGFCCILFQISRKMKRTNSDNVSCSYLTKQFLSCDETSGPQSNEHQETDKILPEIHDR